MLKLPLISPYCKYKAFPEIILLEVFSDFGSNLEAEGSCRLGNRKQVLSLQPCFTLVKVVLEYFSTMKVAVVQL